MKSNYNILGNYIRLVDYRNRGLVSDKVLGISIDKYFMPSVANVIGTDLSKYKLISKGLFACNPMHVGRDERLPVALYTNDTPAIVSPAYFMFEVIDNTKLSEEFLMMWFRRPEFDRICWLKTDGSVRGGITWDDICRTQLPIPPIAEQRKIVESYKVITDRIALKKRINDNLRASGIDIIEKAVGSAALINKTQVGLEAISLPEDWRITTVAEYCIETKSGATPSRAEPSFWIDGTIPWLKSGEVHNGISLKTEEAITQSALENSSTKILPPDTVLMAMYGVTAGEVGYLAIPATTNQAVCGMVCSEPANAAYLFFALLQNQEAASRLSNGGAQDNLSKNFIDSIHLISPPSAFVRELHLSSLIREMTLVTKEIDCLEQLQATMLAELSRH